MRVRPARISIRQRSLLLSFSFPFLFLLLGRPDGSQANGSPGSPAQLSSAQLAGWLAGWLSASSLCRQHGQEGAQAGAGAGSEPGRASRGGEGGEARPGQREGRRGETRRGRAGTSPVSAGGRAMTIPSDPLRLPGLGPGRSRFLAPARQRQRRGEARRGSQAALCRHHCGGGGGGVQLRAPGSCGWGRGRGRLHPPIWVSAPRSLT